MSDQTSLGAPWRIPFVYDFHNWNLFYLRALRYHEAMYPGHNLVSDRIETFRSFMSPNAMQFLGALMASHPRYMTSNGWNEWLACVRIALTEKDKTVNCPVSGEEALNLYQKRKIDLFSFWRWLDFLVVEGRISSDEQRELFWAKLSKAGRRFLKAQSPYFDPADKIWCERYSGAVEGEAAIAALQQMSRKVLLLELAEEQAYSHTAMQAQARYCLLLLAASVCSVLLIPFNLLIAVVFVLISSLILFHGLRELLSRYYKRSALNMKLRRLREVESQFGTVKKRASVSD